MKTPPTVTAQEWDAARERLLVKEKEVTRARDALAAQRRRMPWLAVEKDYEFEGPKGKASLLDLFEGRQQLVIYLLRRQPRRRGAGQHLELPRPGPARPPGDLGGLARGLSADRAVHLVELARRVRPPRDGTGPDEGLVLTRDVTF